MALRCGMRMAADCGSSAVPRGMSKPARKPKSLKPVEPVEVSVLDADDPVVLDDVAEAVATVEPVEAMRGILCDDKRFEWIASWSHGPRDIQLIAKDSATRQQLAEALDVDVVHIAGIDAPIHIASRVITPAHIHPMRVSLTTRELIPA